MKNSINSVVFNLAPGTPKIVWNIFVTRIMTNSSFDNISPQIKGQGHEIATVR